MRIAGSWPDRLSATYPFRVRLALHSLAPKCSRKGFPSRALDGQDEAQHTRRGRSHGFSIARPFQVAQANSRIFALQCSRGRPFAPSFFCRGDQTVDGLITLRSGRCCFLGLICIRRLRRQLSWLALGGWLRSGLLLRTAATWRDCEVRNCRLTLSHSLQLPSCLPKALLSPEPGSSLPSSLFSPTLSGRAFARCHSHSEFRDSNFAPSAPF